jgi:predicted nucleotidyltransferase
MPTTLDQTFALDHEAIACLCESYGVRFLAIFGSVVRGEAGTESDVDCLYEPEPGRALSLFQLVDFAEALSPLLGNRTVDLCRARQLHRIYREQAMREARVIYEK